jgi:hypothetical protein
MQAWRAHILSRHVDEAHHKRGIAETLDLCKRDPPATDLDTIETLHQTLERQDGHEDTMRGLWERAAKAKPQDLEVQTTWFSYAFEGDDWKSAQKVDDIAGATDKLQWLIILMRVGSHEPPDKFSKKAKVLFLGHLSQLSRLYRCQELRCGSQTLRDIGLSHGLEGC